VPRYFFHFRDGRSVDDAEGVELCSAREAMTEAVRAAGEMLKEQAEQFWHDTEWRMDVADELGRVVFTVHVAGHGQ
jgi:hypothetical protein